MNASIRARFAGPFYFAIGALVAVGAARAQTAPATPPPAPSAETLAPISVIATRTPESIDAVPSSVTLLTPTVWEAQQVDSLANALRTVPGIPVVSTGATGAATSVFMRGAGSDETLFLVDGVRMSDRNARVDGFLGGVDLLNVGQIDIVRGPQSPLYGGSAMGGVISLETVRGTGTPSAMIAGEVGSFDTWKSGLSAQGAIGSLGFSAGVASVNTENSRPGNDFDQNSYSARLDWKVSDVLTIGGTFRGLRSTFAEPAELGSSFPDPNVVSLTQNLGTLFAHYDSGGMVAYNLTLAAQARDGIFTDAFGSSGSRETRQVVDWQTELRLGHGLQLVGGIDYEPVQEVTGTQHPSDRLFAWYLSSFWTPLAGTTVTAGVRRDDYQSIGPDSTYRFGVAQKIAATDTKLRATFGTGFNAPSLDDRFGNAGFGQPADPGVRPETSRGWDVGVDQVWFKGALTASATYFRNDFKNLFSFDPVTLATINVGRAQTHGAEFALTAKQGAWQGSLGFTWLEAKNEDTGARLVRRPRYLFSADTGWDITSTIHVGAGVQWVAQRQDEDANFTSQINLPNYTVARVYAAWKATDRLTAKVRVENLLNEKYEETTGFPALPVGVFASLDYRF